MGDRTNACITVYSCPPEQVRAVIDIISEYLQRNDWGDYDAPPSVLQLGGTFGAWEASCGVSDEMAGVLMKRVPGAAFLVHEDPYADWLGSLNAYTPELGLFNAECDANGQPQYSVDMVRKIVQMESLEERETALGDPWLNGGLGALLPPEGQRLLPALPVCSWCGDVWGEDPHCTNCVAVVDKVSAEALHRVVLGELEGTDLVRVVARPTSITFRCRTCSCNGDALNGRKVEVTTTGYWPTEAETHTAHKGFGIGAGNHTAADMEIKEVRA